MRGSSKVRLGLDVGGVYAKAILLDSQGEVTHRVARRHQGNPLAVVKEELGRLNLREPVAVGITGSYAHLLTGGLNMTPVNLVRAEIKAVRHVFPEARNIINVGGSSVTLIQLDEKGRFLDYNTNSLCAAGTGSFLDQQADRLGLSYEELHAIPHDNAPPPIATRCSVFAKSDLIHRQQEGYDKPALWCGLCKSMTGTFLNTLLRGRPLKGLTVLTGGVSKNREVMRWLAINYGDQVRTFEDAAFSGAIGAAHMTNGHVDDLAHTVALLMDTSQTSENAPRRDRLEFRKTEYPSFDVAESRVDDLGNEIRVTQWPATGEAAFYLGIDIGSTSTKAVLMDADNAVLADIYRRTTGDPVGATRRLFTAIREIGRLKGTPLRVLGAATTGSGRKLVGKVIGADDIVNEITAHLSGAMHVDPRVDTIFEIGGQDAKYIHARDGRIDDSNMNYVCAAGTGSFVEEQAKKLGFTLEEIGDVVMGIAPPVTSDRCTVFMEQDVDRLLRQGYSREECMAAVLCSVVKNYFTKVVGRRRVSRERVFFQGATARNQGLVAAFERLVDVEMVVSPYCHVMGAYGAAIVARQATAAGGRTAFRGLDLENRAIDIRTEQCALCQNHCTITVVDIEGEAESPSWGYMCGRDPQEKRVRTSPRFALFQKREKLLLSGSGRSPETARGTIGMPRCLTNYSFYPLWRAFFEQLGYRVALTPRTTPEIVRQGNDITAADFCFPLKVVHGHARALAERTDIDYVFLPQTICTPANPATSNSYFCPYVQAAPSIIRSALTVHGYNTSRLLTPIVDMSLWPKAIIDEFAKSLCGPLGVSRGDIQRAWQAARRAQADFETQRRQAGAQMLDELTTRGEKALVIIGRPYNTFDPGSNLSLPQKIADLGVTVIPMDMLPYDVEKLNPAFENMYWSYGQQILAAAEYVRQRPNLFGVYFSSFSCGPDSFILSFVEDLMGDKPWLTLELDEHGGDAGYLTRIEAFLDVMRATPEKAMPTYTLPRPCEAPKAFRTRKLWLPNMHPVGGPLLEASFRAAGYDAEILPMETRATFDAGRSLVRGSECLPTACTTGALVSRLRDVQAEGREHAFFMPSACGPCRFGQYSTLQRMILNRVGYQDLAIMSPTAENAYAGLGPRLRIRLWEAILVADFIHKAACKVRPYETEPGMTDEVTAEEVRRLADHMAAGKNIRDDFRKAIQRIAAIPMENPGSKPLVGVVGEIYVRSNPYSNDQVVRAIEAYGGEAWLSPVSEWPLYTAAIYRWMTRKRPLRFARFFAAWARDKFLRKYEREYAKLASPFLEDRHEPPVQEVLEAGERLVPINFFGEAILTLGRAEVFARQNASLVVNVAPFSCMPGTITSALCREIQAKTRMPIVSLFYDGEEGMNRRLEIFLAGLAESRHKR